MVELFVKRLECLLDLGEIDDPAKVRVDRSGDMQFNTERMSMHATAFVSGGHLRQAMRSLKRE